MTLLNDFVTGGKAVVGGTEHLARGAAKQLYPATATEATNTQLAKIINQAAITQKINPAYLWGVFGTESNYGQNNAKGGPFQFEPATAKAYGYPLGVNEGVGIGRGSGITDLAAFERQAGLAASYLNKLGINKNPQAALEKYNSGKAGGDSAYYTKVTTKAKTFGSWFNLQAEHEKTVAKTEANPWSPEGGGAWEKLMGIGVTLILVLAGAILLIYGIAVAVRPREKALSTARPVWSPV